MEKNANYMHTEYTMVPSNHRNDMHLCQMRFSSPPLHFVLMTKKNANHVYSSHHNSDILQKRNQQLGMWLVNTEKHVKGSRTIHVTLQFLPLLFHSSTQHMQWKVACPLYSPWNETTDSTLQHDHRSDNWNSAKYTFSRHACTCSWIFGVSAEVIVECGVTWLSSWHWYKPQHHVVQTVAALFYSSTQNAWTYCPEYNI